jgi:tetratricopeptide (TPR) repeat protein
MNIYVQTNRIQDGLELAKQQKRLIDTMLSKSDVPSALQLCQVYRLAKFFEESGRRNSAKEIYIDLISRLQSLEEHSTHSDEDPFMLLLWVSQLRLGEIYRNNGMFNNAESIFQRIISSVQKKTLTQSFAESIYHDIQINLAAVFVEAGQHIQAYQLVNDIINIYEKNSKSICYETARCAFFLRGELNRRCFCFNPALQDLEKALKVAERCRGASAIRNSELRNDSKIEYARIMNTIGLIYEQSGNLKRALEYYYCCINVVEGLPPYMVTAVLHQNAADVLKKIENLDGALVHYKKSLEIRETLHSEDPVREDIATVLYHIALIQYTDGKLKAAFETLEKLIPLRKELLKKENSFLANYAAVFVLKGNCHIKEPGEAQQAKEAFEEAERVLKILTEGQLNLDYARVLGNLGEHIVHTFPLFLPYGTFY